jgi:hypothetical protein
VIESLPGRPETLSLIPGTKEEKKKILLLYIHLKCQDFTIFILGTELPRPT